MAGKAPSIKDDKPAKDAATENADAAPESSLPPVESLDKESDFTPFLAEGVPENLARAALRKLWQSDPQLANLDGLNDYDEDYSIVSEAVSAVVEALSGKEDEAETAQPPEEVPETGAPQAVDSDQPLEETPQAVAASMESGKKNSEVEKAENGNDPSEPDIS
jgi:hypothetical protein